MNCECNLESADHVPGFCLNPGSIPIVRAVSQQIVGQEIWVHETLVVCGNCVLSSDHEIGRGEAWWDQHACRLASSVEAMALACAPSPSTRPFSELRARMAPDAQARSEQQAEAMLEALSTYYLIDGAQLEAIKRLSSRLHTEERMHGDEMRDAGHLLEAIYRSAMDTGPVKP